MKGNAGILLWMCNYTDTMVMSYHSTASAGWEAPPFFLVMEVGMQTCVRSNTASADPIWKNGNGLMISGGPFPDYCDRELLIRNGI